MINKKIKTGLIKGAIVSSISNGVINGLINWFMVNDKTTILLTDNVISSTEETVFAGAVPLAVSLSFILTSIGHFTMKIANKPSYFPTTFLLGLKHAFFVFGVVVAVAVMIQRYAGSLPTTPIGSAIITGLVAAIIGGLVNYLTAYELIVRSERSKL